MNSRRHVFFPLLVALFAALAPMVWARQDLPRRGKDVRPASIEPAVTATMSSDDIPATSGPPCRVVLLAQDGKRPLSNRHASVVVQLDGSTVGSLSVASDANGVADLASFRAGYAKLLKEHGPRLTWSLSVGEKKSVVDVRGCGSRPIPVTFDVGAFAVTGHFQTRSGARLRAPMDLFPAPVLAFVKPHHQWWAAQIRVFREDGAMLLNALRVDPDGTFTIDVDKPGTLRFEIVGGQDYRLVTSSAEVSSEKREVALVVEAKPYCLYGTVRDALDRSPIGDGITIHSTGASFSEPNQPHYALFFDAPGPREVTATDGTYKQRYLPGRALVDITEPSQRHDFLLQPIASHESAIQLRVEIDGIGTTGTHLQVSGEGFSTNEAGARNAFDVVLPKAGRYDVRAYAIGYDVKPSEQLLIDRDQTLRLHAIEKRTHLEVHITDAAGLAIAFPPTHRLHEPPTNCVFLDRSSNEQGGLFVGSAMQPSRRYASSGVGDAGSAVRPDEQGNARFLLITGGAYRLVVDLQRYERVEREIDLKTGESTRITIALQEKMQP